MDEIGEKSSMVDLKLFVFNFKSIKIFCKFIYMHIYRQNSTIFLIQEFYNSTFVANNISTLAILTF